MKKLIFIILLFPLFLISCSSGEKPEITNDEMNDVINNKNGNEDAEIELKKVSEYDNNIEIINEYSKRFKALPKFKQIAEGSTEAFLVTQKIYSSLSKDGNEYIIYNTSNSSMKNQYHEAIFNDKITYRNNKDDEFQDIKLEDYKNEYGVTPYDTTFFDCIINENTVSKIEKEIVEDNYKFVLDLNVETDTAKYLQLQMKKLGDLGDYPKFKSIRLTIIMDNDFMPISGKIEAEYEIKYIFRFDCKQVLDVKFEF